jgi:hypothetical protein
VMAEKTRAAYVTLVRILRGKMVWGRGGFIYMTRFVRRGDGCLWPGYGGVRATSRDWDRAERARSFVSVSLEVGRKKRGEESCDVTVKREAWTCSLGPDSGIDPTCESQHTEGDSG